MNEASIGDIKKRLDRAEARIKTLEGQVSNLIASELKFDRKEITLQYGSHPSGVSVPRTLREWIYEETGVGQVTWGRQVLTAWVVPAEDIYRLALADQIETKIVEGNKVALKIKSWDSQNQQPPQGDQRLRLVLYVVFLA